MRAEARATVGAVLLPVVGSLGAPDPRWVLTALREAVIRIGIDPELRIGPVSLAWHGLTVAIGIGVGALLARRLLRNRGMDEEPLYALVGLIAAGGIIGGRAFYLLEHGGSPFASRGFTFDGGVILAAVLVLGYVVRRRLDGRYLDVIATALPLGVAVGRIGDVINGEHYGARSDFFLAVRNSNPHALTPNPAYAYQNGGLYEIILALLVFAVVWPLRDRLGRPGNGAWLVLGLFSVGRFFEFFLRSDSPSLALGLSNAQWTSVAMALFVVAGWLLTPFLARRARPGS